MGLLGALLRSWSTVSNSWTGQALFIPGASKLGKQLRKRFFGEWLVLGKIRGWIIANPSESNQRQPFSPRLEVGGASGNEVLLNEEGRKGRTSELAFQPIHGRLPFRGAGPSESE